MPLARYNVLSVSFFQPEYKIADPICTFLFSIFVLCTTFTILRDILVVLMNGEPLLNDCTPSVRLSFPIPPHRLTKPFISLYDSGTPAGVKYGEVRDSLLEVKGVKAVHNLHIWALTMNQTVLTAHVAIGEMALPEWNTSLPSFWQKCPPGLVRGPLWD